MLKDNLQRAKQYAKVCTSKRNGSSRSALLRSNASTTITRRTGDRCAAGCRFVGFTSCGYSDEYPTAWKKGNSLQKNLNIRTVYFKGIPS